MWEAVIEGDGARRKKYLFQKGSGHSIWYMGTGMWVVTGKNQVEGKGQEIRTMGSVWGLTAIEVTAHFSKDEGQLLAEDRNKYYINELKHSGTTERTLGRKSHLCWLPFSPYLWVHFL